MILMRYGSVSEFASEVLPVLNKNEAQNNLFIGNINKALKGGDTTNWFYASVVDNSADGGNRVWGDGGIRLVAMLTPPFCLLLFAPDNDVCGEALKIIADACPAAPGVNAERGTAERYTAVCGRKIKSRLDMNFMRLDALSDADIVGGALRRAEEYDLFYLPHWMSSFHGDCGVEPLSIIQAYESLKPVIGKLDHYIFEVGGTPVSMARAGRKTENGIVINAVYTPPQFRNRGYSTSCVYRLSRLMLERGNKFCCLFADAANPVSNAVYRKIGYKDICRQSEIKYE